MQKHFFFDLDNTLTPSRDLMLPAHQPMFEQLCKEKDVVVVTGGSEEQIHKQIPFPNIGLYHMLSQQGNYAIDKDGVLLWHETVTSEQQAVVEPFAMKITGAFAQLKGLTPNKGDLFENRGSQFASSVLGFHAPNEKKYSADPDQSIRRELLARYPDDLKKLRGVGIEAMPAGTTTIDFILVGKNKGYNISRFIAREQWNKDECLYVGDALFPGGNDETVIGVIPTKSVTDPDDTFRFISSVLS
jgi:phosphomannomutase